MPPDATSPDQAAPQGFELINVSKYFGDLVALRNVSLRVEPGESVFLYGANGAGKTTLLRIMAALSRASGGEVRFRGRKFEEHPSPAKSAIGFVSHATFLYGELTPRENLQFTGKLFGLAGLEEKIDRALDLFAVKHREHDLVRQLSRGLQQRVSLARAFLHDPQFVLLDEPFTGLDRASMDNLQAILQRLAEERKSLIFSAHDFERGAAIAQRLVALERGTVKYDGAVRQAPLEELGVRR